MSSGGSEIDADCSNMSSGESKIMEKRPNKIWKKVKTSSEGSTIIANRSKMSCGGLKVAEHNFKINQNTIPEDQNFGGHYSAGSVFPKPKEAQSTSLRASKEQPNIRSNFFNPPLFSFSREISPKSYSL